jgi:colanic acid/amylovoran biosynthesis protein
LVQIPSINHRPVNEGCSDRAMQRPIICLLGTRLDVANMGCRALTVAAVSLWERFCPDCDIRLLYGNSVGGTREVELSGGRSVRVEVVNCRLSPRSRPREHLVWLLLRAALYRALPGRKNKRALLRRCRFIESLDAAVFVGEIFAGDSFSDIYGLSRFLSRAAPSVIALLLGKKLVLLPQTYGPYKHWLALLLARFILRRSSRIYARDRESLAVVQRLLGASDTTGKASFCPDVAFALEPVNPPAGVLDPRWRGQKDELLVGMNISGLLLMGGYTHENMFGLKCEYGRFVRQLLEALMEHPQVRVLLVPHTFEADAESDLAACRQVFSERAGAWPGRLHFLDRELDQSRLKHVIGQCDFFIGSRMHACIAALSQGVPAVGVAYSGKFKGVFESAGMGEMVVDARELNTESCVRACLREFNRRREAKARLGKLLPDLRRTLFGCFEKLVPDHLALVTHASEL